MNQTITEDDDRMNKADVPTLVEAFVNRCNKSPFENEWRHEHSNVAVLVDSSPSRVVFSESERHTADELGLEITTINKPNDEYKFSFRRGDQDE
jgi:hypothetical protein